MIMPERLGVSGYSAIGCSAEQVRSYGGLWVTQETSTLVAASCYHHVGILTEGSTMQVATLALNGSHSPFAELKLEATGQLWLEGTLVLAVSVWGARVGLTLTEHIVLIDADDYWQLLRGAITPAPLSTEGSR
jgi:hypothetical protein